MAVGVRKSYLAGKGYKWMSRSVLKVLIPVTIISITLLIALVSVSLYTYHDRLTKTPVVEQYFSKKVEQHRPLVEKYAEEYGVEDHVDVLMAMIMQESGGRGGDPMQSSESLCGEVNCITEPEESIKQGIAYFSKILDASDDDVELSVQAYNFGIGFVSYVDDQEESYDQDTIIEFSQKMYDEAEDQSKYTCLREEAEEYDACYGDIYYARDVMAYEQQFTKKN